MHVGAATQDQTEMVCMEGSPSNSFSHRSSKDLRDGGSSQHPPKTTGLFPYFTRRTNPENHLYKYIYIYMGNQ